MNNTIWVMAASMGCWLAIGGYLFFLGRKQTVLNKRLKHLLQLAGEKHEKK